MDPQGAIYRQKSQSPCGMRVRKSGNPARLLLYVSITAVPITKLFAWGEGVSGGHVLREEEEEEEEDLLVFNDTVAGPREPAVKPGRITQA